MRKFVLAAVAAIAVAAPTIASATEFGFRIGGDRAALLAAAAPTIQTAPPTRK